MSTNKLQGLALGEVKPVPQNEMEMVEAMLIAQHGFNDAVRPDWLMERLDWSMAIMCEAVELAGHLGWEWWKKTDIDLAQARLEVVDIWAFGMSMLLDQKEGKIDKDVVTAVVQLLSTPRYECGKNNLLDAVKALATNAGCHVFSLHDLATVMQGLDMSVADLYIWYTGKNTLNRFRQDNGYRIGTYQKIWGTYEDNEHLTAVLENCAPDPAMPVDQWIYMHLDGRYRDATRSPAVAV